jgi:hypothetical protein
VDRPIRLALIGALVVIVAACSSTATQSPTGAQPSATPAGGATSTAVVEATPTAAGSASETIPPFELPHNAAELEALLPDKLGTESLTKTSSTGSDFAQSGFADPDLVAWLQAQGKSLTDISTASAFGLNSGTLILAFRINGVPFATMNSGLETALNKDLETPIPWTTSTVSGKTVRSAPQRDGILYLYGVADILFEVFAKDPAIAGEALSKLP